MKSASFTTAFIPPYAGASFTRPSTLTALDHIGPAMNDPSQPTSTESGHPPSEIRGLNDVDSSATNSGPVGKQLATVKPPPHPIEKAVRVYLRSLRNIGQTYQIVMPHVANWLSDEYKKTLATIEKHVPDIPAEAESLEITFSSASGVAELLSALKQASDLKDNNSIELLTRSLFIQMFSEFDVFLGALLKAIYLKNDDLLKGVTREISLADLLEYESIDAVKRAMLDKEIDSFRRDSYVEQFGGLEKKFNLPLKKFAEWSDFVELGQRRNILTHNGGVVSDQYLVVCDREGYTFAERPTPGDMLPLEFRYFVKALRLLSKVGFMLSHTLWSKVFPKEIQQVHGSLNAAIFDCLEQKRWALASELGDFALSTPMRRDVQEIDLRVRVVNMAIGLKFSGKVIEAQRLLESFDWTASYRDFKLAIAVLAENFDEAVELMESIGKAGEIVNQTSYHTWPLFTKFRERPEFYAAYEKIYGESFVTKVTNEATGAINSATDEAAAKIQVGDSPQSMISNADGSTGDADSRHSPVH